MTGGGKVSELNGKPDTSRQRSIRFLGSLGRGFDGDWIRFAAVGTLLSASAFFVHEPLFFARVLVGIRVGELRSLRA